MKYFKYLGGFLFLAVLVSGLYLVRSTEAAVTKEAITKAAKGDFSVLRKQARAANELAVTSAGAQTIVITPSNESQYRKQYPWLDSTHEVNITAPADKDIYIYSVYGLEYLNNTRDVYTNSARTVIATTTASKHLMVFYGDTSGNQYAYLVPKGQTRYFKITHRADTAELFKGVYSNYIRTFDYIYSPNIDDTSVFMTQIGKYVITNNVSVIGEKSPYIISFMDKAPVGSNIPTADVYPGQVVSIKGTEVMSSDVHLDGKINAAGEFQKINGPTEIKEVRYVIPYNLSLGVHSIYLNNVIFGKSNTVWFNVINRPTTPPCTLAREILTVGTVDAVQVPILSRYLNRVTGSTLDQNGTVFTEAVKTALIKEQSVARAYPIYVNLNYYNRAWINGRLTVADCGVAVAPSINVSLVSTGAGVEHPNPNDPSSDLGRFTIIYNVAAVNADAYVKVGGGTRGQIHQQSTGANYLILDGSGNVATTTGQATSVLTRMSGGTVVGDRVKIAAGSSARFSLVVSFDPALTGVYRTGLHSVNFAANQTDPLTQLVLTPAANYRTNAVTINNGSVSSPLRISSLTVATSTLPVNTAFFFGGQAAGGTAPYTYRWTWGDGAQTAGQNASHSYVTAGVKMVNFRVTDAVGTSVSTSTTVTVTQPSSAGQFVISSSTSTPPQQTIVVHDTNDTDNIDVFSFNVRATGSAALVRSAQINFISVGAGVGEIIDKVYLVVNGETIGYQTVSSSTATSRSIVFNNLDWDVPLEQTTTVTVRVDINDLDGNFSSGDSFTAYISATGWSVQNSTGTTMPVGGSVRVNGNQQTCRDSGVVIDYVSSNTEILDSNGDTAGGERARYNMVFDVTAFENDMYLPAGATVSTSSIDVDDAASYAIENANGQQIPLNWSGQASSTAFLSTTAEVSNNYYVIQEGDTERFTLGVDFVPKVDGSYRLQLYGLNYNNDLAGPANNMERALPENTFQTTFVDLNATEIARRQGLMASAWEAIQGFLVRIAVGR